MSLATRPPQGSQQNHNFPIKVNCFPIQLLDKANATYFQYHVAIDPDIKPIARRREILRVLQVNVAPEVFTLGNAVGYDGKAILFATRKLNFAGSDSEASYQFSMSQDGPPPQGPARRGVQVTLRLAQELSLNALVNVLHGGPLTEASITANQLINVYLMQSTANVSTVSQVRTKTKIFSETSCRTTSSGFELWHGYFMNARPSIGRMLLNLDVTTAVMYQRGDLVDLALTLLNLNKANARLLEDVNHIPRLQQLLKGLRVRQQHAGKIGKVRTIREIVSAAGRCTFEDREGQSMTVEMYFFRTYNHRLRYPLLPGVKSTRGDIVPFELLRVVEGQIYRKPLNPATQAEVQRFSTRRPEERFQTILQILQGQQQVFNDNVLMNSRLNLSPQYVTFDGRVLEPPKIGLVVNRDQTQESLIPSDGKWDLFRNRIHFYKPCTIGSLALANFDDTILNTDLEKFLEKLFHTMGDRGINLNFRHTKKYALAHLNPQGDIDNQLGKMIAPLTNNGKTLGSVLLLAILPPGGTVIRRTIKRIGDITRGFATQCLMKKDLITNASPAYILNIVLKINVRMGGTNAVPREKGMEWIGGSPTMIIGADVSHPGPGILKPSITGLAFSLDKDASKYCALTTLQHPRLEIIVDLKNMVKAAFQKFEEYNTIKNANSLRRFLPHRIVFYRDGVSEGEYEALADTEFVAIKKAIEEYYPTADPKTVRPKPSDVTVTFIVVGKRHHMRFFPDTRNMKVIDRSGNCPAGLVVDDHVVHPSLFDFYLLSHAGILGTSRPAHYIVLKDENNFSSDSLQALSYGLCHCYAAATRSVSIPAPVFYADLVCQRSDIHIRYEDAASDYGTEGEYVADEWSNRFKGVCEMQKRSMYFV